MKKASKRDKKPSEIRLKRRVKTLILKLIEFYPDFKPKKLRDPLEELILTILSQNTNDKNSFEGFGRLKDRFPNWEDVVNAKPDDVIDAISISGLAPTKTVYIQNVLKEIGVENRRNNKLRKGSPYHLDHLKKMKLEDAIEYLISFKGVGQKTAACVLAFSMNMPSFPIDTHVYRILVRQGIISRKISAEKAHQTMYTITQPDDRYRLHMNLIRYGREICHSRNPECEKCVIRRSCIYLEELKIK